MTISLGARGIRGLVLDIEGTTTPITFVHDVLFPYARERMRAYLRAEFNSREVREASAFLAEEWSNESGRAATTPPWLSGPSPAEALADYAEELMKVDRKSRGLKILQGKIWEAGYRDGTLHGDVYADVPRAFTRWRAAGHELAIYSSGSVLAQKLLFGSTQYGDLTKQIRHHFDTEFGAKTSAESYARISSTMRMQPGELLFVSDSKAEVDAAQTSGMQALLCVRDPAAPGSTGAQDTISTFDEVD